MLGVSQWLTGVPHTPSIPGWQSFVGPFLSVFLIGISVFRDRVAHRWFRSAILWFAFSLLILATVQTFTSHGKIFWLFDAPYAADYFMGPILYRNHYAAFIEAVLPIALYLVVRRERNALSIPDGRYHVRLGSRLRLPCRHRPDHP